MRRQLQPSASTAALLFAAAAFAAFAAWPHVAWGQLGGGELPAIARLLDRDGDGSVAEAELPREIRQRFLAGLDQDGDRRLSAVELRTIGRGGNGGGPSPPPESEESVNMKVLRNVDYVSGYADGRGQLDLYLPLADGPSPVILFFHGGGLYKGDKGSLAHLAPRLVSDGFVVVAANYRLSPEAQHPAQVEDGARAARWVWDHIADYGGDRERLVLAGGSAGGYIVALLTYDARFLTAVGLSPSHIMASIPITALTDVRTAGRHRIALTWDDDPQTVEAASPLTHARADAPPTLLMVADGDTEVRREQNIALFEKLRDLGHPAVELHVLEDRLHSTILRNMTEDNDVTYRHMMAFLHRYGGTPRGACGGSGR